MLIQVQSTQDRIYMQWWWCRNWVECKVKRAAVDGMEELSCSVALQPPPSEQLWQQDFSALLTFFWTKITSWDFPPASLLPFLEPQVNINNLEQWLPTCRKEQAYVCELFLSFKSVSNLSLRNCEMMSLLLVKKLECKLLKFHSWEKEAKNNKIKTSEEFFFRRRPVSQFVWIADPESETESMDHWIKMNQSK